MAAAVDKPVGDSLGSVGLPRSDTKSAVVINVESKTNGAQQETPSTNGVSDHLQSGSYGQSADHAAEVRARYQAERDKRIRVEGNKQFVKLHTSEKYKHFTLDPWLPAHGSVPGIQLQDGDSPHFKFVIKGAGYGGLLYAARLVEAGYDPNDFAFIDYAGGFGGTWYWNRYPGLMCDVAASIYMPLLEETEYMPKHKYAYGQELREHAERIVKKYGFNERGIFRATVNEINWSDTENFWMISVTQERGPKQGVDAEKVKAKVFGDFVVSMSGVLNYPKLPRLPGIDDFEGHQFHTSRWDYKYTGGSQEQPDMVHLKDKVVGIVGTGPTTVQAFPHIAKWAKQVYLFQRTPSAVDVRCQQETDPVEWKKQCSHPGWQRERMRNFAAYLANDPNKPPINLVDDAWTCMPSYSALTGGPNSVNHQSPETIMKHIESLHALDLLRQDRIRARVDEIVKCPDTAQLLKAWYPGWCKRPCFHDDYLPTFNRPNVQLVDTEGRGIGSMTRNGVVVAGKEYKLDVLVWGTGFAFSTSDPGERAGVTICGRNGRLMSEKFANSLATLHGCVMRDFPNLFFPFTQCGVTGNAVHVYEATAEHSVFLIKEAERRNPERKVLVEPTAEAEEAWAMRIVQGAAAFGAVVGCTPSYLTAEGMADKVQEASPTDQLKIARMSFWSQGILGYERVLEDWRQNGNFEGVDVTLL